MNDYDDLLLNAINSRTKREFKNYSPSSFIFTGYIEKSLGDNKYDVIYNNAKYTLTLNHVYSVGDSIHIIYPNEGSSQKFVLEDLIYKICSTV